MVATKLATSGLFGSIEITSRHNITPDAVAGDDIFFDVADTSVSIDSCTATGNACAQPMILERLAGPVPWEQLFGSATGVQLNLAGDTADFFGTATTMPVTIADGASLRIVNVTGSVEFIDYDLTLVPEPHLAWLLAAGMLGLCASRASLSKRN